MAEQATASSSSKAPNPPSGSRSARASTLPSSQPTKPSKSSTTGDGSRKHHKHYPYHRHHHSHQIQARELQSAHADSSGHQFPDLLSPVRSVAGGLGTFGTKQSGASTESGMKVFNREKANKTDSASAGTSITAERGHHTKDQDNSTSSLTKTLDQAGVQRIQSEIELRDKTLKESYNNLASHALASSIAVSRAHDSLTRTLASTQYTLSQLQKLRRDSAELLTTLTTKSIPKLTTTTQDRLANLVKVHSDAENRQLAGLEKRINTARDRTEGLRQRVAVCAERVGREEAKVREERKRRQWWVGFVWALLGIAVLVWVSSTVWRRWAEVEGAGPRHQKRAELRRRLDERGVGWVLEDGDLVKLGSAGDIKQPEKIMTSPVEDFKKEFSKALAREIDGLGKGKAERDSRVARLFDEL